MVDGLLELVWRELNGRYIGTSCGLCILLQEEFSRLEWVAAAPAAGRGWSGGRRAGELRATKQWLLRKEELEVGWGP